MSRGLQKLQQMSTKREQTARAKLGDKAYVDQLVNDRVEHLLTRVGNDADILRRGRALAKKLIHFQDNTDASGPAPPECQAEHLSW